MNTDADLFEIRKLEALRLLQATGIRPSNFAPPAVHLAWRLGIRARPPHFAPFWSTAAVTGISFGLLWSILMWLLVWEASSSSLAAVAIGSGTATVLFGFAMASYYAYGRRKNDLPSWQSLGAASSAA